MNILQRLMLSGFLLGFILSLSEGSFLLNICLSFVSCRPNESYLKLTPTSFDPNFYDYTIHIPNDYPFYKPTGPVDVNFYVGMNVSNTNGFNSERQSVAKSVLYNAVGNKVLASTELAYSSNEMLAISAQLWRPEDRVTIFDTENKVITKLVVYQFNNDVIQQSDPYTLTFKRNE